MSVFKVETLQHSFSKYDIMVNVDQYRCIRDPRLHEGMSVNTSYILVFPEYSMTAWHILTWASLQPGQYLGLCRKLHVNKATGRRCLMKLVL